MDPVACWPVRDAASVFLRAHAEGAPLFPAGSFASDAALARRARAVDDWDGDRAALAAFLAAQNAGPEDSAAPADHRDRGDLCDARSAALHPAQAGSLKQAAHPQSLFVLTGQQPGLLGGPALALHKALTTVAWARAAAARLGRPVVPIFWIAGDDSDLPESNTAEFLEPGAPTTAVSLGFSHAADAIPMSLRVLDEAACRRLHDALPPSWSPSARALAAACYRPGRSLTEAFRALMHRMLGPQGVLFVDGFAAARRPEAQAVLRRVAMETGVFHDALARGTTRLRETLAAPPQVPVRPGTVPVFLFEDERRVRLYVSDTGRVYEAGREAVDLRPELSERTLLHSALTRPLVVEALFPVLGHVLGPAELRYFAQLTDVFAAFGCGVPLLAPRRQAMVVPRTGLRALEALGFQAAELSGLKPSRVRARLMETAWAGHPASARFPQEDHARFRDALAAYQGDVFPGGGNRFEAARRRLDHAVEQYRDAARALVFDAVGRERFQALQPLLRWLAGGFQDRHLNTLSLWNALAGEGEGAFDAYVAALCRPGDDASVFILETAREALT